MNDAELRSLIRAAVQRHIASSNEPVSTKLAMVQESEVGMAFGQYHLERAAGDTMCLIEPAVRCNHCGFCKCHGH